LETKVDFLQDIINTLLTTTATDSASLSLEMPDEATFSGLMVTGQTVVNDLGITGDITAGLLKINGLEAEINSLGLEPLKIQSKGLADIQFMNGKVTIDTTGSVLIAGDLTIEGSILGSDSVRGINVPTATGSAELTISFLEPKKSADYAVSIAPNFKAFTWITNKTKDDFTINFSDVAPVDGAIDWIIIE
jgi:hypothetical protein